MLHLDVEKSENKRKRGRGWPDWKTDCSKSTSPASIIPHLTFFIVVKSTKVQKSDRHLGRRSQLLIKSWYWLRAAFFRQRHSFFNLSQIRLTSTLPFPSPLSPSIHLSQSLSLSHSYSLPLPIFLNLSLSLSYSLPLSIFLILVLSLSRITILSHSLWKVYVYLHLGLSFSLSRLWTNLNLPLRSSNLPLALDPRWNYLSLSRSLSLYFLAALFSTNTQAHIRSPSNALITVNRANAQTPQRKYIPSFDLSETQMYETHSLSLSLSITHTIYFSLFFIYTPRHTHTHTHRACYWRHRSPTDKIETEWGPNVSLHLSG